MLKAGHGRQASLDELNTEVAAESDNEVSQKEIRLACLDDCMRALPENGSALILEYYRDVKGDRIGHRKRLAQRFGLNREALANRAQRLRDKLERCVVRCVAGRSTI